MYVEGAHVRQAETNQQKNPPISWCQSGVDVVITIFGDFCQFSAKKMALFSKTNVIIIFL
jgi:hypothetical protein